MIECLEAVRTLRYSIGVSVPDDKRLLERRTHADTMEHIEIVSLGVLDLEDVNTHLMIEGVRFRF